MRKEAEGVVCQEEVERVAVVVTEVGCRDVVVVEEEVAVEEGVEVEEVGSRGSESVKNSPGSKMQAILNSDNLLPQQGVLYGL